ncbi:sarcosine oxidase subunit alpha family protein [Alsobacter soli]|uniref:Sarcosine oxidase subunit alpha family protein n=1 Tax=Alsobacter soli TaxID=2109933 RepID=A0A2T1HSH2_9HYPH|nr:sarcosine oxidase subunit alpha family protein [Alsobacter soli]PSC04611.1 sarcosine oxidase subunit alpha family protein [Alsobacter soli]
MARLPQGGRIDRSRPLAFRFDGRTYHGFQGDTLASALLANGVSVVGRSFKHHRPRGVLAAGDDEPNALVQLEPGTPYSEPNVRATRVELYDGLTARSVNAWPSARFDVNAATGLLGRFMPAGFYYKTFMWPDWRRFEPFIRRAAGLGVAEAPFDPEQALKRHAHCDLLVVGAGPAGLAAARAAAAGGGRVILAEVEADLGGSLLSDPHATIEGQPARAWVAETEALLAEAPHVTVLRRTTVTGYYDHNELVAVERLADHLAPAARRGRARQRIWHIRARRVVLGTGAHERPLVFPDNDRPGVLLASAARTYLHRFAVLPGSRAVVATNNDSAYEAACDLHDAGMRIAAIADLRPGGPGEVGASARERGIEVLAGSGVTGVRGRSRVRGVQVSPAGEPEPGRWLEADLLLMSGGWTPAVHLFSQSGGALAYDPALTAFRPDRSAQAETSVGAAAGRFSLAEALADGHAAGGGDPTSAPQAGPAPEPAPIAAAWRTPGAVGKQWVDFQSDATEADVALAAREGFISVEHLKRYTTIGMATDQGKTSNVNALAILGEETGRLPPEVGTTRFRAPYTPITMTTVAAGARGDLFAPRRKTPLDAWHREHGAVMEDFGAWSRPDVYLQPGESHEAAARREHLAVRQGVGLFDSSPIGKIAVSGRDAARFLDFIIANRIANLGVGKARYGLMLTEHGVVFDDGVTFRLGEDSFLLSPSSGAAARVYAWLDEWRQCEFPDWDLRIADLTTAWAAIAVAGPRARDLVRTLPAGFSWEAAGFPHMTLREGAVGGAPLRAFRVSFSGEVQYELQVPASYGLSLWEHLMRAGAAHGVTPVGVEAWLRLRLEKGYIHVGSETDGNTLPDDIGFGPALAAKPGDFVGRLSLLRENALDPDREQLVGLESLDGDKLPVGGCLFRGPAFNPPVEKLGRVTSSAFSPALGHPVALGLLKRGRSRHGEVLNVFSQGWIGRVRVTSPVFYDQKGERLRG